MGLGSAGVDTGDEYGVGASDRLGACRTGASPEDDGDDDDEEAMVCFSRSSTLRILT